MIKTLTLAIMLQGVATLVTSLVYAAEFSRDNIALRPAHTYSIVARDEKTGQLGAAVQSHWFSVGSDVIWAQPGVGAVATQSFVEVSYGPLGLAAMAEGKSASESLQALLSKDEHQDVRQVGMIDANGVTAVHTGSKAIIAHCDMEGDNFTVQANLMENATVCKAMADAFSASKEDLAGRMMVALEAAQQAGGDIRGKQSAAMFVVEGEKGTPVWKGKVVDLRVEDSVDPIIELSRLLKVSRGYSKMTEGDDLMTVGEVDKALSAYTEAEAMLPDNHEAIFWHAATLAAIGRVDESLPLFSKAFAMHPLWRKLVPRLPASGLLPDDQALIDKIVAQK